SNGSQDLASAEVFDPTTGAFSVSAANLATARSGHRAFLLPNNNSILIVGGTSGGADLNSAEIYFPWTDSLQTTGSMSVARSGMTGSALSLDGRFLAAGGANLSSTELYGFATAKTDASDYAPGAVVTITGSGWQQGETVTLSLVESPLFDTHPNLTAVADGNGNISNNQFSPDAHDVGIRFYLTAVGSQSGSQAQNTFTDNKTVALAFSGTGNGTVTSSGGSGTLSCTSTSGTASGNCSNNGFGNTDTVTLTATPISPSTVGAWNMPAYTVVSGCTTGSSTCKFTMNNTSQTITVAFNPGPVSATTSTVSASPTSVIADGVTTSTVTVTLKDASNSPISGKAVSLAAGSGSSTIAPASATTDASGQAAFTVKDTAVESVTYTATDTTDPVTISQTATVNFSVGPVNASASTVSASPFFVTADGSSTSTITITLKDANSHPVSGKTVTLTAGSGSSTISASSGASNASGVVTFTVKDT
ncbi:MAG: Ig-like domain-containing protein, partial [bacterium]